MTTNSNSFSVCIRNFEKDKIYIAHDHVKFIFFKCRLPLKCNIFLKALNKLNPKQ